jgi:hypothetical protein
MRKENCLWSLLTIIMVAMLSLSLVSCGDDDDKSSSSSVSGLYYYGDSSTRTAYNFVNGNTVEMYGAMSSDPNAKWRGESGVAFPLRSGWYYWSGNKHVYSYAVIGDKVIIGSDRVMTISGNTLIYDDMGVVLYKWN